MLISKLKHYSQTKGDRIAIKNAEISFTYAELYEEIQTLIPQWQALDIQTLALLADNSPAWAVVDFAATQQHCPIIPLPLFFSQEQIQHSLRQSGANYLLTDHALFDTKSLGIDQLKSTYVIAQQTCYLYRLNYPKPSLFPKTSKITYTSGSTGQPKGVCLSLEQIETVVANLAERVGANSDDTHLATLPLATLLENIAGLYVPLLVGGSCCLPSLSELGFRQSNQLEPKLFYQAIRHYQATSLITTPEILKQLLTIRDDFSDLALRFVAVGGAVVSPLLLKQAQDKNLPAYQGYGLSELASVVAVNTLNENKIGSVGRPLPHIKLRFTDANEIIIQSQLFLGYLGQTATDTNSWHSGDLGYFDEEGYLFVTGRKRNVFISSYGRNISPEWIEQSLCSQTLILQAYVFGEAQPYNVAVITSPTSDKQQLQTSIDQVNQTLPDYAQVKHWLLKPPSTENRQEIWQHYQPEIENLYSQSTTDEV